MTSREAGFLLLTSRLGNIRRSVLSSVQLDIVEQAVLSATRTESNRDITQQDLLDMGLGAELAQKVLQLLDERFLLDRYLQKADFSGITPITRVSHTYPLRLHKRLSADAPGCLWAKGNMDLLKKPAIALVGSRELFPENAAFAKEVGKQAALQGFVLVSGNARGADSLAQESCLSHGGGVICVLPDRLTQQTARDRVLYISEDGFDLPFSSSRALRRNRIIHALGGVTFIAQCRSGHGGTWSGVQYNLQHNVSPMFCYNDASIGTTRLMELGIRAIEPEELFRLTEIFNSSL